MVLLLRIDSTRRARLANIMCAVVAGEVMPLPSPNEGGKARIEVRLRFIDHSMAAVEMFADINGSYILFDVRAGFFSFEPILESLKEINPLALSPVLKQLALTREPLISAPPAYLTSLEHFDLTCLLKPGCSSQDLAWAKRVPSDDLRVHGAEAPRALQRLSTASKLDRGQVLAFLETLQRSMAITQGPPGLFKFPQRTSNTRMRNFYTRPNLPSPPYISFPVNPLPFSLSLSLSLSLSGARARALIVSLLSSLCVCAC